MIKNMNKGTYHELFDKTITQQRIQCDDIVFNS